MKTALATCCIVVLSFRIIQEDTKRWPQFWTSNGVSRLSCFMKFHSLTHTHTQRDTTRMQQGLLVYYTASEAGFDMKASRVDTGPSFKGHEIIMCCGWSRPWVSHTLAAFHKVELFTVRWIRERGSGGKPFSSWSRKEKGGTLYNREMSVWNGGVGSGEIGHLYSSGRVLGVRGDKWRKEIALD